MKGSRLLLSLLNQEKHDRLLRYTGKVGVQYIGRHWHTGWYYLDGPNDVREPDTLNWCFTVDGRPTNFWIKADHASFGYATGLNTWRHWRAWGDARFNTFQPSALVLHRLWEWLRESSWEVQYTPISNKRNMVDWLTSRGFTVKLLRTVKTSAAPESYDTQFANGFIAWLEFPHGEKVSLYQLENLEMLITRLQEPELVSQDSNLIGNRDAMLEIINSFCGLLNKQDKQAGSTAYSLYKQVARGELTLAMRPS